MTITWAGKCKLKLLMLLESWWDMIAYRMVIHHDFSVFSVMVRQIQQSKSKYPLSFVPRFVKTRKSIQFSWVLQSCKALRVKQLQQKCWICCRDMDEIFIKCEVKVMMAVQQWKGTLMVYVQTLVTRQYPTAVHTHFATHVLNLVIARAATASDIANCVNTVVDLTNFIRVSVKRMQLLQQSIGTSGNGRKRKTLTSFCSTRRVERRDSLINVLDMFPTTFNTLELMTEWSDDSAASKTSQYFYAMPSPKFIIFCGFVPDFQHYFCQFQKPNKVHNKI